MAPDYPYGYQGLGHENLKASLDKNATNAADIKEMFNVCLGSKNPAADMPTPRWPVNSESMQRAYGEYYRALESLSEVLYRVCALALGLPEDWFADKITQHRNALRSIYYPAQKVPPLPGQVRASTHTDYGSLTILRVGGQVSGGLQAMGVRGNWIDVDVEAGEDAFIINLGDLMAKWTNDRWMSTPHRVLNPVEGHKESRNSVAYFCNLNMDARVECIPTCLEAGCEPRYEPTTSGEHLMRKHNQTVAGQLCYQKATPDRRDRSRSRERPVA
jgi:isopenicillin N synthase-like dioxygenase